MNWAAYERALARNERAGIDRDMRLGRYVGFHPEEVGTQPAQVDCATEPTEHAPASNLRLDELPEVSGQLGLFRGVDAMGREHWEAGRLPAEKSAGDK